MKNKLFGLLTVLTLTFSLLSIQEVKIVHGAPASIPNYVISIEKVFEEIKDVKPDSTKVKFEVVAGTDMESLKVENKNVIIDKPSYFDKETQKWVPAEMHEETTFSHYPLFREVIDPITEVFREVMEPIKEEKVYKAGDVLFTFTMPENAVYSFATCVHLGYVNHDIDLVIREVATDEHYDIDRTEHRLVIDVNEEEPLNNAKLFWDGKEIEFEERGKTPNLVIENKAKKRKEPEKPVEPVKPEEAKKPTETGEDGILKDGKGEDEPKPEKKPQPETKKEDVAKGMPTGVQTNILPVVIVGVVIVFGAVFGGYKVYVKKKK